MTYFQSEKKLNSTQLRWQDFLAEFDFTFEYKAGKANFVADAFSRKAALAAILSSSCSTIVDDIREDMQHDPVAKQLLVLAHGERVICSILRAEVCTSRSGPIFGVR